MANRWHAWLSTKDEQGETENLLFLEGVTMRNWMWAALAAGFLMAGESVASANDTIRLGGPSAVQGNADTELVRWRHHHGGHYGRGYYGGFYGRGYHGGLYGRAYYAAYYRR